MQAKFAVGFVGVVGCRIFDYLNVFIEIINTNEMEIDKNIARRYLSYLRENVG